MSPRNEDSPPARARGARAATAAGKYQLTIPLDAAEVVKREREQPSGDCCDEPVKPEQVRLKVAARAADGTTRSTVVQMGEDGRASATIGFDARPGCAAAPRGARARRATTSC